MNRVLKVASIACMSILGSCCICNEPSIKKFNDVCYVREAKSKEQQEFEKLFTMPIPFDVKIAIWNTSEETDYPIWLLCALAHTESDFTSSANSKRGAKYGRGLCQISDICLKFYNKCHTEKYTVKDMYNPQKNLNVATWYLTDINHYSFNDEGSYVDLYMAYNVGPAAYKKQLAFLNAGKYYNEETNKVETYKAKNRFENILCKYKEEV